MSEFSDVDGMGCGSDDCEEPVMGDKLMEFKVGDRVKIEGVLEEINFNPEFPFRLKVEGSSFSGVTNWRRNGKFWPEDSLPTLQLVERPKQKVKKKISRWANIYPYSAGPLCMTRENADREAEKDRIACVELVGEYECEE